MRRLPKWMRQHQISVEPYLGAGAYGPQYGPAAAAECFLDEKTRTVRSPTGTQVTSSSTALCALDTAAPALSRVTLADGRVTTVINALRRDGGRLPVPSHLELQLT